MMGLSLPADSIRTILVTRLDGLGDLVLGTSLLEGLHARWPSATVQLVVRPSLAGVAAILPEWVVVRPMPFDPRLPLGGNEGRIAEQLRTLATEVRAELAIVAEYNRTWAGEILAATCGAPDVIAFDGASGLNLHHRAICDALGVGSLNAWQMVHVQSEEREPAKYDAMLRALGVCERFQPTIVLRDEDRRSAERIWAETGANPAESIVCFPSSNEGLARSLDGAKWVRWIDRLRQSRPVVLLGSEADERVLEEIAAAGLAPEVTRVVLPLEKTGVLAAFLAMGGAYIGMDTGPMHIAAALGRPTLGIYGGGHGAHRFLPVGARTAVIRMPMACYGCDWLCPFDRRHCIKDIPDSGLHDSGERFLNDRAENADPLTPRLFDLALPAELAGPFVGPMMRQHRQFLKHNHDVAEHHAYLAAVHAEQSATLGKLREILDRLGAENHHRANAIEVLSNSAAEMTRQNATRDAAISQVNQVLSEMTLRNNVRDDAIAHITRTLAEMTRQNDSRDNAIAHINQTLADMTRQNEARDKAIARR